MPCPATDASEIVELTETLLRAYARIAEQEAFEDDRVQLVPGAAEAHWPAIEASFAAFDVPFDPGLRALYGRTLGLHNPICYIPVLVPPAASVDIRGDAIWEVSDFDGLMDTMHLWPQEWMFDDEDAFPFLVIGYGDDACLTIDSHGRWSAKAYFGDGGPLPERDDFTLSFTEAFRIFAERMVISWARASLEDPDAWDGAQLNPAALPDEVRLARDRLTAPLDLDALPLAKVIDLRAGAAPAAVERQQRTAPAAELDDGFDVVGLPFADYDRARPGISVGTALRLHPVDDNPHDAQAVEVWFDEADGGPARLGFVPRGAAPAVRERLVSGEWGKGLAVQSFDAWHLRVAPRGV